MSRKPASPNSWMPIHLDAWRTKTRRLSPLERCAYMDLLIEYWDTQKPLEINHDDFANLVGIPRDQWDSISDRVLRYFEKGDDGLLHNRRMDEEIAKAGRMLEQKRKAGRLGGKASSSKRQADGEADAQARGSAHGSEAGAQAGAHPRGLTGQQTVGSKDSNVLIPNGDAEIEALITGFEADWDNDPAILKSRATARKKVLKDRVRGVS